MRFTWFVHLLSVIFRLGEKKATGVGRERVRQILAAIARPFGLQVIPFDDGPTKDVNAETIEAGAAVGHVFDAVNRKAPPCEIERHVVRATDELQDIAQAVKKLD